MDSPLPSTASSTYSQEQFQKAALLLIALDPPYSLQLMQTLSPLEIEQVSYWLNQFNETPQENIKKATEDFYYFLKQQPESPYLKRSYNMHAEGIEEPRQEEVLQILKTTDVHQLAFFLKDEPSANIVLLLTSLEHERAEEIVKALPLEKQEEIRKLQNNHKESQEVS